MVSRRLARAIEGAQFCALVQRTCQGTIWGKFVADVSLNERHKLVLNRLLDNSKEAHNFKIGQTREMLARHSRTGHCRYRKQGCPKAKLRGGQEY